MTKLEVEGKYTRAVSVIVLLVRFIPQRVGRITGSAIESDCSLFGDLFTGSLNGGLEREMIGG